MKNELKFLDKYFKDFKNLLDSNNNEIAKGYIIRGKVLKYSKVCVSKKLIKK